MNLTFTFIIIERVNIWQLVQLISFSKSFTGLFHFCDWYLAGRNINVTTWCFFIIQNFLQNSFPFWNEISLNVEYLTLPWSPGFYSAFQRITPHLATLLIKKNHCLFLPLVRYIYIHVYVVYMYIHIRIFFHLS
jgi:hypothetical protein